MRDAMGEEYKHFSMDLEFLLRQKPEWREIAQGILFKEGDIVEHGEAARRPRQDDPTVDPQPSGSARRDPAPSNPASSGSLGIGSLKGRDL